MYDHIRSVEGHLNVEITKELLIQCRTARSLYHSHLENEKKREKELLSAEEVRKKTDQRIKRGPSTEKKNNGRRKSSRRKNK